MRVGGSAWELNIEPKGFRVKKNNKFEENIEIINEQKINQKIKNTLVIMAP